MHPQSIERAGLIARVLGVYPALAFGLAAEEPLKILPGDFALACHVAPQHDHPHGSELLRAQVGLDLLGLGVETIEQKPRCGIHIGHHPG